MNYPPFWTDPPCAPMGKKIFVEQCAECHTIQKEEKHHEDGPNLFGIVGSKVGSKKGYEYSDACKSLGEGIF